MYCWLLLQISPSWLLLRSRVTYNSWRRQSCPCLWSWLHCSAGSQWKTSLRSLHGCIDPTPWGQARCQSVVKFSMQKVSPRCMSESNNRRVWWGTRRQCSGAFTPPPGSFSRSSRPELQRRTRTESRWCCRRNERRLFWASNAPACGGAARPRRSPLGWWAPCLRREVFERSWQCVDAWAGLFIRATTASRDTSDPGRETPDCVDGMRIDTVHAVR